MPRVRKRCQCIFGKNKVRYRAATVDLTGNTLEFVETSIDTLDRRKQKQGRWERFDGVVRNVDAE